jgi:hypothetical protein
MPEADFGKNLNLPSGDGRYAKLSKKGDKIKFRIAGTPHYETKHFLPDKTIALCEKYNADDPALTCKYCDDYQKAVDIGDENMARQMKPVTTFYYPIVDLNLNKARIFQFTAKGIHYGIKGYADEGVDVFGCDWVVERTEDKKAGYYKVLRLDSKALTKEQDEQLKIAKTFKLNQRTSKSIQPDEGELTEEDMKAIDEANAK